MAVVNVNPFNKIKLITRHESAGTFQSQCTKADFGIKCTTDRMPGPEMMHARDG